MGIRAAVDSAEVIEIPAVNVDAGSFETFFVWKCCESIALSSDIDGFRCGTAVGRDLESICSVCSQVYYGATSGGEVGDGDSVIVTISDNIRCRTAVLVGPSQADGSCGGVADSEIGNRHAVRICCELCTCPFTCFAAAVRLNFEIVGGFHGQTADIQAVCACCFVDPCTCRCWFVKNTEVVNQEVVHVLRYMVDSYVSIATI